MKTIRNIIDDREPYHVSPDMTVSAVIEYLCEREIGAVAICEGSKVVGVFSERDLMRRVIRKKLDPAEVKVADVMTSEFYFVSIDEKYNVAQSIMLGKNFRHLVVLDGDERLQGFVSMRDLLEADLEESKGLIRKLNDDYYRRSYQPDDQ